MANSITLQHITEDTTIGDIVEHFPEVIDTLLGFGVHCLGCQVSTIEPLGEGLRSHGMSDEEVRKAVEKLNEVLSQEHTQKGQKEKASQEIQPTFTITPLAAEKIKSICSSKQKKALRLGVKRGGCSGNEYTFELADTPKEADIVLEQHGATVYVDSPSLEKMNGSIIDYKEGLTDAGFRVKNPLATKGCGCGKSFG